MIHATVFAFSQVAVRHALEYRDRVAQEVSQEAARFDGGLRVTKELLLSSPDLQSQFYEWMGQTGAVRWHPRIVFAMEFAIPLQLTAIEGCGELHFLAWLPCAILSGLRVAMEMRWWPKQTQSMASVLHAAYVLAHLSLWMAFNDPCYGSMSPNMASMSTAALYAAITSAVFILAIPCTIQHLYLCCCIAGIGNFAAVYTQHLQHNGSLSMESDPHGWGLLAVAVSTLASLILAFLLRVRLAKHAMMEFLQSKRP